MADRDKQIRRLEKEVNDLQDKYYDVLCNTGISDHQKHVIMADLREEMVIRQQAILALMRL